MSLCAVGVLGETPKSADVASQSRPSSLVLTHTAPAQGLFDLAAGPRAVWQMPRTSPPTVYLTQRRWSERRHHADAARRAGARARARDLLPHRPRDHGSHGTARGAHVRRRARRRAALRQPARSADVTGRVRAQAHDQCRSHRAAHGTPSDPRVPSTRGLAFRDDVRRPAADRLSADRMGLEPVGLERDRQRRPTPPSRRVRRVSNLATSWSCTTATSTTLPRISGTLSSDRAPDSAAARQRTHIRTVRGARLSERGPRAPRKTTIGGS